MSDLTVRFAREHDIPDIFVMICELAEYERLLDQVRASEAKLRQTLFGPKPGAEVLLAQWEARSVGFALFFPNYSTFLGQPGIYLEDLFVKPAARGKGVGLALLRRLAALAVERGCGRVDWQVLDWNAPSIEFYRKLGAEPMSDWTTYRLTGSALRNLAIPSVSGELPA